MPYDVLMSADRKTHPLTIAEEKDLDRLADGSEFFGRIRAAFAEWGTLTHRQYEVFSQARDRDAWRKGAKQIGGVSVRNRYETPDGSVLCGSRAKPSCRAVATIVVGNFGYCSEHADEAKRGLDEWRANLTKAEPSPSPSVASTPDMPRGVTPLNRTREFIRTNPSPAAFPA